MKKMILTIGFAIIFSTHLYAASLDNEKNREESDNPDSGENADGSFLGRLITLRDFGADDLGFLSLPEIPPKYGVLLIHDSYGLDERIKRRCDWIAARGQIALGLDLFNGHVAKNDEETAALQKELRQDAALNAINSALRLLDESPRLGAPKIIVVAMGKQCPLTLPALKKHPQKVIGITWIEPDGTMDEKLFQKNPLPLQIIYSRQNNILSQIRANLDADKRKSTILIQANASTNDADEAWNRAFTFWLDCANGKWKSKGFLDNLFD